MAKARLSRIKLVLLLLLVAFVSCWFFLHFDSVHQRRRAERLFADVRAFPYESADFEQVRDFSVRHGGSAAVSFQSVYSTCTANDCDFDVSIQPTVTKILSSQWRFSQITDTILLNLGLRPWATSASFSVRAGVLQNSTLTVAQERFVQSEGFKEPIEINYRVETDRTRTPYSDAGFAGSEYVAFRPHVTGPPEDILVVSALQTADAHWRAAFDVRLDCLTSVLRGCDDFNQLAPAAWSRYKTGVNAG
jgi:hypothetical protein